MKVTKSQKIYLLVLGVGVCALILDRCFGEANRPAVIPVVPPAMLSSVSANVVQPAGQMIPGPISATIAERLDDLSKSQSRNLATRDAFAIPATFIPARDSDATASERVIQFQMHKLKAVINQHTGGQAVVDDSLITVGEYLDGFKLESVSNLSASFTDGAFHVVLRINQADDFKSRRASAQ